MFSCRSMKVCLLSGFALARGMDPLLAQVTGPGAATRVSAAEQLTPLQAQTDFALLRSALEEAHDGLYRFSTKPDLEGRFEVHRARLSRPISKVAFRALISEMLADTRDGHLRLEYDEATTAALGQARLFPYRVRIEGDRIIVLFNDTPTDSTIRPGMEILSINGRPASDVLSAIVPRLPGDGFIETGKRARLGREFGRYYWLLVDQAADFTVTARDAGGRTVTAVVAGVPDSERNSNTNPVNAELKARLAALEGAKQNVSVTFVNDNIAYLRIRVFDGEDYREAIQTVFRALRDRRTSALILDLRGNGGGVDQYGALLVAHLTDRPFRYFDRIHLTTIRPRFATWKPSTFDDLRNGTVPDPAGGYLVTAKLHNGVAEQTPAAQPFLGGVAVLIDGGTFSTAADVTAVLHHLKRATFVGEETGGTYEGNTSGLNALLTLPNSGLKLKIPMYGYWNAVSPSVRGRGTLPDYPVERTVADMLAGVDPQWQQAVAVARAAREDRTAPAAPSRQRLTQ